MPEGTRLLVLGPLIKDRKTEGDRVFEGARKQGFVRVRVDGEQYDLVGGADARQVQAPHDRGRRRPVRRPPGRRARGMGTRRARAADRPRDEDGGPGPRHVAPRRLDRDGAAPGRGRGRRGPRAARRRARRVRGAAVQRALQLPVRRHDDRRAGAALVLVQLAARRLPHLHRPRHAARHRPGAGHPGPLEVDPRRRAGAVEQDADRDQRGG